MGVQRQVQIRRDHLVFFEKRGVEVRNRYPFKSTMDISCCNSISSQTIRSVPSNARQALYSITGISFLVNHKTFSAYITIRL